MQRPAVHYISISISDTALHLGALNVKRSDARMIYTPLYSI